MEKGREDISGVSYYGDHLGCLKRKKDDVRGVELIWEKSYIINFFTGAYRKIDLV